MKINLDGKSMNSIDDFYNQLEKYLTVGECPWGRNLDSLDEVIMYSFNYTDDSSLNVTEIIWSDSSVVKQKLNQGNRQNLFELLVETLSANQEVKLTLV